MNILILLFFSSGIAFSKINVLPPVKAKKSSIQVKRNHSSDLVLLKKLKEQSEKISRLLESGSSDSNKPIIWDGAKRIESTKIVRGILLNSVVSSNLESPLLIQAFPNETIPEGTKFRCSGITKNKRVLTICDRMITPTKEIEVKVQVLNLDGTAGLRGEYNDGKDSYIAGAVISEFAKGIITASKSRLILPLGQFDEANSKNAVLEGIAGSAGITTDVLLDEMKSSEPKVYIEAGKPVLLFFMEGINVF